MVMLIVSYIKQQTSEHFELKIVGSFSIIKTILLIDFKNVLF